MAISTSETVKELFTALSKAQANMQSAKRTADNPFFKSKYADLDEIWSVAKKPLTDNGLSVMQGAESDNDAITVTCRLCHNSGEWAESSLRLTPTKRDPQAFGSAITYGRRYLLASMVGVVTDDDDGNAASDQKQSAPPTTKQDQKLSCSVKQWELITRLSASSVVTDAERERLSSSHGVGRIDGSKTIEWLQSEIESRNKVLQQEKTGV